MTQSRAYVCTIKQPGSIPMCHNLQRNKVSQKLVFTKSVGVIPHYYLCPNINLSFIMYIFREDAYPRLINIYASATPIIENQKLLRIIAMSTFCSILRCVQVIHLWHASTGLRVSLAEIYSVNAEFKLSINRFH